MTETIEEPVKIEVAPHEAGLQSLCGQVSSFATQRGLDESATSELCILLEELFTNSLKYGQLPRDTTVSVAITCKGPRIHVQYIDQGIEFDPVDHRAGSAGLSPVQQLRKGGLGLNMIDHYCEHFEYRRHEDRNVIDLVYDTSRTAS